MRGSTLRTTSHDRAKKDTVTSSAANPAAAFYASSRAAVLLGAGLRAIDRLAPAWGTRVAFRLFCTPLPWKLARRRPVPASWSKVVWPFEGASLAVYRRDDLEPGRPVVLLVHGWAGSALQLHPISDALAAAGLDPILLDFPAHGRSSGWRSTLPQFSRAIHAVASRVGPLHAVVAHSLGSLAALHTAASGLAVERLVLIAPASPPATFLGWFAGSFRLSATLPERMREHIERVEGVSLAEFEPEWLADRVTQPTLVVHDEQDRVAPFAAGERLAGALRAGRLHVTRGSTHRRVMSDAAVTAEVVGHCAA
jgi:pimeloyl-ACP methyl ester carboxylesterase